MSYSKQELIDALTAGGHMSKKASEHPGDDFGEDLSIILAEGDKLTCVIGADQYFDSFGEPGDIFILGPSQFKDNDQNLYLFSGGYGRGFTLLTIDGKWHANTYAGVIAKLIEGGYMLYETGPRKAST